MRKLFFILGISLFLTNITAQELTAVTEGQSQLVYSLPVTELVFELEVEKTTQTTGPYFQYSERYLATNQVIVDAKTTYKLKNTTLNSNALPDPQRTYAVPESKYTALQQITVNEKGLLTGINCEPTNIVKKEIRKEKRESFVHSSTNVLPLTEEYLMAGSTARLAEGAAKQIYRIRESRISLLTGDLEHMPADGASIKTMLNELNRMEQELTELFTGKVRTETVRHTIRITPREAADKMLLFRISAHKGLVDVNDLSGVPYFMSITPEKSLAQPLNPKAKKTKTALYNILPAQTTVSLSDGINTLLSQNIAMPQFGLLIPLSEELFKSADTKLCVDPNTGRTLRLSR